MSDNALLGTQFIKVQADTASYDSAVAGVETRTKEAGAAMEGAFAKVNPALAGLAAPAGAASKAVDGLNRSLEVSILKQQLATATRANDAAGMAVYAGALEAITAETSIASGANEVLARTLQQLTAQERVAALAAKEAAVARAEANDVKRELGIPVISNWVLAAAAAAVGAFEIGKKTLESADHIEHLSQQLGISTESLSRWEFAGKTVGIEIDDISRAVGLLAKQMVKGTDETGKTSKGLENLGLSAVNSKGQLKSTDEMLGEIAERFKNMPDGPLKTAAAMEIFGRSGKQMIPLLNLGKQGLDELKKAAEDAGYVLSEDAAKQAHELSVQIDLLELRGAGLARTVMTGLVPALTVLTQGFGDAKDAAGELNTDDDWFSYFTRGKVLVTAVAVGLKEVLAASIAVAKITGPAMYGSNPKAIWDEYAARMKSIGQQGVNALEGVAGDPNKKDGGGDASATDRAAQEASDKANAALQKQVIEQLKARAELQGNRAAVEQYTHALDEMAFKEAVAGGASSALAGQLETLTTSNRRATQAAKDKLATDKETERYAKVLQRIAQESESAEKNLGVAIDTYYVKRDTAQRAFEAFMLGSEKRMTTAMLSGKALEVAATKDAAEQRRVIIQNDLEEGKVTWDQAKAMILQSETETNEDLLKIDQKYANDYVTILKRLVVEQSSAKDQMIHYAEQAAGQMTTTMSNAFFDVITGKFNDLGKVAKNFLNQLLKDITNFLAEQATKKLLELALNFAQNYAGGSGTQIAGAVKPGGIDTSVVGYSIPRTSSPNVSVSSITAPPGYSSSLAYRGPVPAPSSPGKNGGNQTVTHDIRLAPGLLETVITASANAGYGQVMGDFQTGGPAYRSVQGIAQRS